MRTHRSTLGVVLVAFAIAGASCGGSDDTPDPPDSTFATGTFVLGVGSAVDTLAGAAVSPAFAAASRAKPLLGRFLASGDFAASASPVVVLGNDVWIGRFRSEAEIIGTQVRLNGHDATVVGVMPAGFNAPRGAMLWAPRVAP